MKRHIQKPARGGKKTLIDINQFMYPFDHCICPLMCVCSQTLSLTEGNMES